MLLAVTVAAFCAASAAAADQAAAKCTQVYSAAPEAELCGATEALTMCIGKATADMKPDQALQYSLVLQVAQRAAKGCVPKKDQRRAMGEEPTIETADGSVKFSVHRREADVKFHRYQRSGDVSVFGLKDQVDALDASTKKLATETAAKCNDTLDTVKRFQADYAFGLHDKFSKALDPLKTDIKKVKDEIGDGIDKKFNEFSSKTTKDLNAALDKNKKEVTTVANDAKKAADAATKAAGGVAVVACAGNGLKYDAKTAKCVADSAPKCDSAALGAQRVIAGKLQVCTMYVVGSSKKYSFAVLQPLDASLGSKKEYPARTCKTIKTQNSAAKSGIYWIQATDDAEVERTYCDMTTAGGGWTLVSSVHEGDIKCRGCADDRWSTGGNFNGASDSNNYYMKDGGPRHWSRTSTFGEPESATFDDFKTQAYSKMSAKNMMIMNVPNGVYWPNWYKQAHIVQYTDNSFLQKHKNLAGIYVSTGLAWNTCSKRGPKNVPVKYAKGDNNKYYSMGAICPNCRGQSLAGYWSFAQCNGENSKFAFCQSSHRQDKGDCEHWCVGQSYVQGHGTCSQGDYGSWDWSCGVTNYNSGWSNSKAWKHQTHLFFYRE